MCFALLWLWQSRFFWQAASWVIAVRYQLLLYAFMIFKRGLCLRVALCSCTWCQAGVQHLCCCSLSTHSGEAVINEAEFSTLCSAVEYESNLFCSIVQGEIQVHWGTLGERSDRKLEGVLLSAWECKALDCKLLNTPGLLLVTSVPCCQTLARLNSDPCNRVQRPLWTWERSTSLLV